MADPLDLAGRTVLVAGGAAGIGRGVAERFRAAGAEVEAVEAAQPDAVDRFDRLDVAVIIGDWREDGDATEIVSRNLLEPLAVAQRANAVMQDQDGGGSIVNVASVAGLRPSPGLAAFGAAQASLLNLTQTLAVEWAPKVRVNSVTAGLLSTGESDDDVAATVPLGRLADAADVGDACLYFASGLSGYASGANLVLHGGGEWPAFLRVAQGRG